MNVRITEETAGTFRARLEKMIGGKAIRTRAEREAFEAGMTRDELTEYHALHYCLGMQEHNETVDETIYSIAVRAARK